MSGIIITNNPLVKERCEQNRGERFQLEFHDTDYAGILTAVRDKIHSGHALVTHPLSGSIKPGETPYKTVIVTAAAGKLDTNSLNIIEESIQTCEKFKKDTSIKKWNKKILADFQLVDYNLIYRRN